MSIVTLVCSQCGGKVDLDDSREFGFCGFCGTKLLIQQDITHNTYNTTHNTTQNIVKNVFGGAGKDDDELITDGLKLLQIGQTAKAAEKFKQAVDEDPVNWKGWLYYGETLAEEEAELWSTMPLIQSTHQQTVTTSIVAKQNEAISAYQSAVKITEHKGNKEDIETISASMRRAKVSSVLELYIKRYPDDEQAWADMLQYAGSECKTVSNVINRLLKTQMAPYEKFKYQLYAHEVYCQQESTQLRIIEESFKACFDKSKQRKEVAESRSREKEQAERKKKEAEEFQRKAAEKKAFLDRLFAALKSGSKDADTLLHEAIDKRGLVYSKTGKPTEEAKSIFKTIELHKKLVRKGKKTWDDLDLESLFQDRGSHFHWDGFAYWP